MGWALEGWVQRAVKVRVMGAMWPPPLMVGIRGTLACVCPLVLPVQLLEAANADSFLQDIGSMVVTCPIHLRPGAPFALQKHVVLRGWGQTHAGLRLLSMQLRCGMSAWTTGLPRGARSVLKKQQSSHSTGWKPRGSGFEWVQKEGGLAGV